MSISEFERNLEAYYEQHRNQQLTSQLEDAVQTMRETLLLGAKYEGLPDEGDEDRGFSPNQETVEKVGSVKTAWKANRFDDVEDQLPDLTDMLDTEKQRVRDEIQGAKHELSSHLEGLESLNRRLNRVQPHRIKQVKKELESLDSVSYRPDQGFEDQERTTRKHVRKNVVAELKDIEEELMGPFRGTGAERHVQSLISGDPVHLSSLSEEELGELQSTLSEHLSLKLRGE